MLVMLHARVEVGSSRDCGPWGRGYLQTTAVSASRVCVRSGRGSKRTSSPNTLVSQRLDDCAVCIGRRRELTAGERAEGAFCQTTVRGAKQVEGGASSMPPSLFFLSQSSSS